MTTPAAERLLSESYPPSVWAPPAPPGPDKGSASPGDVFPAEATITASDGLNAAKLGPLGYVAAPATAWTTGQQILVGTFAFHWSGTAWAAAAAADEPEPEPPAAEPEPVPDPEPTYGAEA